MLGIVLPACLFLVIATVGVVLSLSQPRIYESEARLWIQPRLATDQSQQQNIYSPFAYFFTDPLRTVCELIKSQAVLSDAYSVIKSSIPASDCPSLRTVEAGLAATPVKGADIVSVKYQSSNPRIAKKVLAAVVDSFMQLNTMQMSSSAVRSREFSEHLLKEARDKALAAQEKVKKFQNEHGAVNLSSQVSALLVQEQKNNSDIEDIKLDISTQKAKLDDLRSRLKISPEEADVAIQISQDDTIKSLKDQLAVRQKARFELNPALKDTHPRVRRANQAIERLRQALKERAREIAGEEGVMLTEKGSITGDPRQASLLDQMAEAQIELHRLEANLAKDMSGSDVLRAQLNETPSLQQQLAELTRASDNATQELNKAEDELHSAKSAEFVAMRSSNIQMINSPYEPTAPVAPNVPMGIASSFILALISAGLVFFLINFLFNPFVSQLREISAALRLPIVGWCESRPNAARFQELLAPMQRARQLLVGGQASSGKLIVVTSSDAHEGKGIVAAGLALSFAQTGSRIALVDASGTTTGSGSLFNILSYPGLSDFIASPTPDLMAKIVRPVEASKNLAVITAGSEVRRFPADSSAFRDLLTNLAAEADVIIVETPALSESSDALSLVNDKAMLLFVTWMKHCLKSSFQLAATEISQRKIAAGGVFLFDVKQQEVIAASSTPADRASTAPATPAEASVW
jgi:uncharacterized protein involved in exopolysaccharide biosynthesis/Mrp family chromosome partitioning ATPase